MTITFVEALSQQQNCVKAAYRNYQKCNCKFDHLFEQVLAVDARNIKVLVELNNQLEIAEKERQIAMNSWDAAISAINDILNYKAEEGALLIPLEHRTRKG